MKYIPVVKVLTQEMIAFLVIIPTEKVTTISNRDHKALMFVKTPWIFNLYSLNTTKQKMKKESKKMNHIIYKNLML